MPLYEYQCASCGHRFELIQKFSDPPAKECPRCGGAVEKLISSPAFQFKGSGWYVTDYGRKSETVKSDSQGSTADSKESRDLKAGGASSDAAKDSKSPSSSTAAPSTPAPKSS